MVLRGALVETWQARGLLPRVLDYIDYNFWSQLLAFALSLLNPEKTVPTMQTTECFNKLLDFRLIRL